MAKQTRRQRAIAKYGGLDEYKAHMHAIAAKGGSRTSKGKSGFAVMDKEKLRLISIIGGKKSRPRK